jgi:hypothetical protein
VVLGNVMYVLAVLVCSPLTATCHWDLREPYGSEERCVAGALALLGTRSATLPQFRCEPVPLPRRRPLQ